MATGTHDHADDPRNAEILIWVNGELLPRERAVVSVFDSGFVLGDGVWEGLRVSGGHPAFLERHLDRLEEGARAIMLDLGMSREELTEAIYATLRANEMTDGVHVRLMVTRGVKSTPYQDPRMTIGPATVVIIAEHKEPMPATVTDGITLFTTHVRRATPDTLDPKLNAHSKLNDIQACIQAYTAGADEALMLDPQGFVATCNSTHFFIVTEGGEVWTSDGRFCLAGITRAQRARGVPAQRHPGARDDVQPDRRLQRGRGVRDRDLRRRRAGAHRRRPHDRHRAARAGGRTGCRSSTSGTSPRTWGRAMTVRVAMWSGPRNISTAMMRSWENRPDTAVVDEPFYAAYLAAHRARPSRPRRGDRLAADRPRRGGPAAGERRLRAGALRQAHDPPHRSRTWPLEWVTQFRNVLLIRDPAEVVASYVRSRESCEPEDIGLLQQVRLLDALPGGATGHRRRRLPARPRGLPAVALRLARHRVHRPDAALARRAA